MFARGILVVVAILANRLILRGKTLGFWLGWSALLLVVCEIILQGQAVGMGPKHGAKVAEEVLFAAGSQVRSIYNAAYLVALIAWRRSVLRDPAKQAEAKDPRQSARREASFPAHAPPTGDVTAS
jgi:hypothetical protein